MSLFDQLVAQALKNQTELAPLRVVVEKELLHHDIIREMSSAGLLRGLTFMGDSCLRACYGANRLSEDLDFTGGSHFKREALSNLADVLIDRLERKYGLEVDVDAPVRDTGNVDTWKLKLTTRPEQKDLPAQKISIDICALPSYDKRPVLMRNDYGVDMGTAGLIIQAQSREEILADKLVALALRPNRIKYRDLWDIVWLKQHNIDLPLDFIPAKISDHKHTAGKFLDLLKERKRQLQHQAEVRSDFIKEMQRFLPPKIKVETIENEAFWDVLKDIVSTECQRVIQSLAGTK